MGTSASVDRPRVESTSSIFLSSHLNHTTQLLDEALQIVNNEMPDANQTAKGYLTAATNALKAPEMHELLANVEQFAATGTVPQSGALGKIPSF